MKLPLLLILTLLTIRLSASAEEWTNRVAIADRHALATMTCAWPKKGLTVQLAGTNQAALEFRIVPSRKPAVRLISDERFPENFEDAIQTWPAPAPATNPTTLALRRQSHAWMLYVADAPVARFPEPWATGAVTLRHPVRALPPAGARAAGVQRTPPFHLDAPPQLLQHGVALLGNAFDHSYRFHAAVQHLGGTNGLVFLVTDTGACHGFTVATDPETQHLVFQLWRGNVVADAPRQALATIATELLAGQWTLMEVRVLDDCIVCRVNDIEILRERLPLPSGGRFGLIESTGQATRFSDISAASQEDYRLDSAADLQFHTLQQNGTFRDQSADQPLTPAGGDAASVALESPGSRTPRQWIFGATDDGPHKLELCLQPETAKDFACSLITGWQGSARPYFRFTCRQQGAQRIAMLEQVSATNLTRLDSVDLGPVAVNPLRLTLDALRPHELRGLINGRVVAVAHTADSVIGASGLQLEGRNRIRFSLPQLVGTDAVYAGNVFDTEDHKSAFPWTSHGGDASSGMILANTNSFAGLWSNFELSGDFCVDFDAGMCRGCTRAGDLNLTVLSRRDAPCDGYSVTLAGWDPDLSQQYTRLFRNGELVAVSTTHTVPRFREGPLTNDACYTMRFQRVGNQLHYIFNNESILSWKDPAPLAAGSLGIWTYRNAIAASRVRVTAESMRPKPFRFWTVATMPEVTPQISHPVPKENLLNPAIWQGADPVSQPQLQFTFNQQANPELRVMALASGGTFLATPHLPSVSASGIRGWHFEIARHPEARFNFEFSAGIPDATHPDAILNICTRYSFVLCGSDDPRGERRLAGRLPQPPMASPPNAGSSACIWTPVDVWLPSEIPRSNFSVRITGFGNLQPGDLQQGLAGNPPGAWYAVRDFHEIPRAGKPDDPSNLVVRPDPEISEALRISSGFPWPNELLPARSVILDGQPAMVWQDGNDQVVLLPRSILPPSGPTTLRLDFEDGRAFTRQVPPAAGNPSPVLLACEMTAGGIQTFETRTMALQQFQGRATVSLFCADPLQGTCIRFQNNGAADARLDGRLLRNYDPVVTPLLQFRYKADPMAHISLTAGQTLVTFSEGADAPAMLDNAWHTWLCLPLQSNHGGLLREGFDQPSTELRMGSRLQPDQTGCYSAIAVDDIATGPVVGPKRPLSFRLNYHDCHGLAKIFYAIAVGPEPWSNRPEQEQAAVPWIAVTNNETVTPDLSVLPDGCHHMVMRAHGAHGTWSTVSDIPFLIARQPPHVAFDVRSVPDRYNGTCLDIFLTGKTAPPLLRNLRLSLDDKPLDLTTDNGRYSCNATNVHLEIDWPWLLRREIRNHKDGDTLLLTLDGMTDAAGNDAAPLHIPIRLDLAADKQPPTVLPLQPTTNLLVFAPQFHAQQDFFNHARQIVARESQKENGCSFVPFRCQGEGRDAPSLSRRFTEQPWDPEAFPWLAMSVRIEGPYSADTAPFALQLRPCATSQTNNPAFLWSLPLTDHQPFVIGPVDWKPGKWVDLLVNVRDLLRNQCKTNKACTLREIAFLFPPKARFTLQVRGMAILAPWEPSDALKFKAYDLSGIGGLVWQNGGKSAKTGIRPACLTLPPEDAPWLKLRVADRQGNLSQVFMVPLPPNAAPIPDNLPLEVDVEDF